MTSIVSVLALFVHSSLPAFFFTYGGEFALTKQKRRKGMKLIHQRCPYCGAPVVYRSADGIYKENSNGVMLYVCSNYPRCDAYVRVHAGTRIPVGTLANQELRSLRRTAHKYFDQLYQCGIMSKEDAYRWLAELVCAPLAEAHIGYMGEYYCKLVAEKSKEMLARHTQNKSGCFRAARGGSAS